MRGKSSDKHLRIVRWMSQWSTPAIRISFGILKPFGLSSAEEMLKATVAWLPVGTPEPWLSVIKGWEVAIGI